MSQDLWEVNYLTWSESDSVRHLYRGQSVSHSMLLTAESDILLTACCLRFTAYSTYLGVKALLSMEMSLLRCEEPKLTLSQSLSVSGYLLIRDRLY